MSAMGYNLRIILRVLSLLLQILKELFTFLTNIQRQNQINVFFVA
jgi:hypothetical protein